MAQNDPQIRRRGQTPYPTAPIFAERRGPRCRASRLLTSAPNHNTTAENQVCEPWLVEALGSFDEEASSARELRGKTQGREKATTPSQEIIRQTKASWTGQSHDHDQSLENSPSNGSYTDHRPLITRSQTLQRGAPREVYAPRLSLWSDSLLSEEACKSSAKRGIAGYPRRQTQTFHEVPLTRRPEPKLSEVQTYRSSRRLQAITGVACESEDQRKGRKVKEYHNLHERNNEGTRYRGIPARTSSMLPLHGRRESSVYCMVGGPATPPPSSPLPAIPTSSSLTSCRSSTSKASLLYTPISPIPTLSTSASTWSWRLNADSPGSQLLNEMKNATDVVEKSHKPNVIPTKRHVQQRSITSSLSSAGLLDDVPKQTRQVGSLQHVQRNDVDKSLAAHLHVHNPDTGPTGKTACLPISVLEKRPALSQEATASQKQQEGSQSSKSTASNSAGSPSSIINLYMSRSQQTIFENY